VIEILSHYLKNNLSAKATISSGGQTGAHTIALLFSLLSVLSTLKPVLEIPIHDPLVDDFLGIHELPS